MFLIILIKVIPMGPLIKICCMALNIKQFVCKISYKILLKFTRINLTADINTVLTLFTWVVPFNNIINLMYVTF